MCNPSIVHASESFQHTFQNTTRRAQVFTIDTEGKLSWKRTRQNSGKVTELIDRCRFHGRANRSSVPFRTRSRCCRCVCDSTRRRPHRIGFGSRLITCRSRLQTTRHRNKRSDQIFVRFRSFNRRHGGHHHPEISCAWGVLHDNNT